MTLAPAIQSNSVDIKKDTHFTAPGRVLPASPSNEQSLIKGKGAGWLEIAVPPIAQDPVSYAPAPIQGILRLSTGGDNLLVGFDIGVGIGFPIPGGIWEVTAFFESTSPAHIDQTSASATFYEQESGFSRPWTRQLTLTRGLGPIAIAGSVVTQIPPRGFAARVMFLPTTASAEINMVSNIVGFSYGGFQFGQQIPQNNVFLSPYVRSLIVANTGGVAITDAVIQFDIAY